MTDSKIIIRVMHEAAMRITDIAIEQSGDARRGHSFAIECSRTRHCFMTMTMRYVWTCHCCGQEFDELPLSFGAEAPLPWLSVKEAERQARGYIDSDRCVIDHQHFFVRGCLEVPIVGGSEPFVWSIWVSLSEQSFALVDELWEAEQRDHVDPLFGWSCNSLPGYPDTFALKTRVHLRNGGMRPFIELEPTDHPLAVEQREGITMQRVADIAATCMRH